MQVSEQLEWIAVDWGTTNMRAFALTGDDTVLARADGPGLSDLTAGGAKAFDDALCEATAAWVEPSKGGRSIPVVMCGMVGSRQGWREAPYIDVPAPLTELATRQVLVQGSNPRLRITIVPGMAQTEPPDVMRGEETQLLGVFHASADRHTVCLPGTHSKWVRVSGGRVERFSTALTGEMFSLLRKQSILRHSMVHAQSMSSDLFARSVGRSFRAPQSLMTALFGVRARSLLHASSDDEALAELSGLLLGAEFAGMLADRAETVTLIGEPELTKIYAQGLDALGISSLQHDGASAAIAGLAAVSAHARQPSRVSA